MIYKVYLKNYLKGTASFLGALPERRERTRKGSLIASAFKWARLIFGGLVSDARALFIIPFDDEKGASSIEYAFLICLIVVVCILILRFLGESLEGLFKLAAVLIPRR